MFFVTEKKWFVLPEVGEPFKIGAFMTSPVTEVFDEKTIKTLNSIYEWNIEGEEELK